MPVASCGAAALNGDHQHDVAQTPPNSRDATRRAPDERATRGVAAVGRRLRDNRNGSIASSPQLSHPRGALRLVRQLAAERDYQLAADRADQLALPRLG